MPDKCRRCGECRGRTHHWRADCIEGVESDYACKHCPVRGIECPECSGDGCAHCKGEGVVPVQEPKSPPVEHADLDATGRLRDAVNDWKQWHRELVGMLAPKFAERNTTLDAIRQMIEELRKAREEIEERRQTELNGTECSSCLKQATEPICMYCDTCYGKLVAENEQLRELCDSQAVHCPRCGCVWWVPRLKFGDPVWDCPDCKAADAAKGE